MTQGVKKFLEDVFVRQFLKLKEPYCSKAIGAYIRETRGGLLHTSSEIDRNSVSRALSGGFYWGKYHDVNWCLIHKDPTNFLKEGEKNE